MSISTTAASPNPQSMGNKRNDIKGFWPLIYAQFQGAFNDNAYKQLLIVILVALSANPTVEKTHTTLVTFIFTVPFLLFSMYGGVLAERFSKRSITIGIKIFEILIMLSAIFGFWTTNHYIWLVVLFSLGVHSSFFGPTKYGILPEIVPYEKLSWANGILELTTFIGIIMGTFVGSEIVGIWKNTMDLNTDNKIAVLHQNIHWLSYPTIVLLLLTITGLFSAFYIKKVPASNPSKKFDWNFFRDLKYYWKFVKADCQLFYAIIGFMFFWCVSSVAYMNIIAFTTESLQLPVERVSWLLVSLILGIGSGSYLAGVLSRGRIELGLVSIGGILMVVCASFLSLPGLSVFGALLNLCLLGFGAGFYIVPIQALIQHLPHPTVKGGIQGLAYWLSNVGSTSSTLVYMFLFGSLGFSPRLIWLTVAFFVLLITVIAIYKQPVILFRTIMWILNGTLYRLNVLGKDNIPLYGGALIVSNPISFTDALFLATASPRPIRFLIHEHYLKKWYISHFAKGMGVIPVGDNLSPRKLIETLKVARQAIANGDLVCIVPERSTATKGVARRASQKGFERIMEGLEGSIVPVYLDNIWGNIIKISHSKFFFYKPLRIPYPITISFGEHLPPTVNHDGIVSSLKSLETSVCSDLPPKTRIVPYEFIRIAKLAPFRQAVVDASGTSYNYLAVLALARNFMEKNKSVWSHHNIIAIVLPQGIHAIVALLAILMYGRIPLVLSPYTKGNNDILQKYNINIVIDNPDEINVSYPSILSQLFVLSIPSALLFSSARSKVIDRPAIIALNEAQQSLRIPLVYSHRAVLSLVNSFGRISSPQSDNRYLAVEPFDSSIPLFVQILYPLLKGLTVICAHKSATAEQIAITCEEQLVTHLVVDIRTLQSLVNQNKPAAFTTIQKVYCYGDLLPKSLKMRCVEAIGKIPCELFGTAEMGGLISYLNPTTVTKPISDRLHSVGKLFRGTEVKIIDRNSGEELSNGRFGYLFVHSPHMTIGYLNNIELTKTIIADNWINTGYIAAISKDGILTIDTLPIQSINK
ncbi:MAG: MFS transporter [Candidatus Sumerlaeales bacterium]|nr:MFS transporter [Candidatus Sumerlaeales bacterium]